MQAGLGMQTHYQLVVTSVAAYRSARSWWSGLSTCLGIVVYPKHRRNNADGRRKVFGWSTTEPACTLCWGIVALPQGALKISFVSYWNFHCLQDMGAGCTSIRHVQRYLQPPGPHNPLSLQLTSVKPRSVACPVLWLLRWDVFCPSFAAAVWSRTAEKSMLRDWSFSQLINGVQSSLREEGT